VDADGWPNTIGTADQLVAGYAATPQGQAANFRDVLSIVRAVPNGRSLGAFYSDATWTAVKATAGIRRIPVPAMPGKTLFSELVKGGKFDANPQNLVFPEAPSLLIDANGKMITKWF
jgi:arabinogalactan endo-1,4-beta-galactosidase